jgi:DNA polymerase-4
MEDRGVDEVYIDFTDVPGGQREGGRVLARLIQKSILDATGLTCSIGVAPNKLLAKMASEFTSPTASPSSRGRHPAARLAAAGAQDQRHRPQGGRQAAALGIHTVGELAARRAPGWWKHFGRSYGAWLHDAAWGRDDRPGGDRTASRCR